MSFQKKKINDLNKQVIQKIITFQIKDKKSIQPSLKYTSTDSSPFHLEKNQVISSPQNGFYFPKKSLNSTETKKAAHQTNKSLDSLPNFRIVKNKFGSNYLRTSVEKDGTPQVFQKTMNEIDIASSTLPKNIKTSSTFLLRKEKIQIDVIISNEKEISVVLEELNGKTIKVLKNKVLNEIKNHIDNESFEKIIGFKSSNKLYLIDYVLDFDSHTLGFLEDKENIKLTPIYKEISGKRRSLRDFDLITILGSGGFSKVLLSRNKNDGKLYALKIIDRSFIKRNKKEGIIMNERNIMASTDHPCLVDLYSAFKTKKYLVFVMEWCPGGELFFLLKNNKRISEEKARFYFIEICLGVQYLHSKNIIYRDLKPENLLFDIDGHLKIADFGLAKPDIDDDHMAYSFCGSPEYMSPEMLAREGHDRLVDIYGLGLLLYEMVIGIPPFYSPNFDEIFKSVITENVKFPSKVILSAELKSLITKILMKKPEDRIGFIHDVDEILNHPWCKKINQDDILHRILKSPFNPDYFHIYFEPTKDIDEIKFLKDLQFEKNDEVLNEIYDTEENERALNGFSYEKQKNKVFLKRNFITKTHFPTKTNDFSLDQDFQGQNHHHHPLKLGKNNLSTGHLIDMRSDPNSTYKISPLIIFPTSQMTPLKSKPKFIQETNAKNVYGYVLQNRNEIINSILPSKHKLSENLYNFNKESILQKKINEQKYVSKKKMTG